MIGPRFYRKRYKVRSNDAGPSNLFGVWRTIDHGEIVIASKLQGVSRHVVARKAHNLKAVSSRRLAQVLVEPCLSASMSKTLCPWLARSAATLMERVVLPTPPFWFRNAMITYSH